MVTALAAPRRRGLAPLHLRDFRLLTIGQLASNTGDGFYAVALPWYVLAGHGSALLLGSVLTAYGIPRTLLVGLGGQASDRWRPWTVMMAADLVRLVAVAGLAAAAWAGPANPAVLVPTAALLGAGEGLFLPASFSIIPALVPDADLQAGNALSSAGTQLATLLGPALGGALVALAHPAAAFAVDAVTFGVSAATLSAIRVARRAPRRGAATAAGNDGAASSAVAGTTVRRLLRTEPVLVVIFAVSLAANLGSGGMSEVALPALAHGPLHSGAGGYGLLVASIAVGGLIGTLLAGQVADLQRPAVVASAAFLVEAACMAAIPYLGSTVLAGAALALFGGLNGFGNVLTITAFQRWAPPHLLGRLMSLILLASFGVFPVSVALGGLVVSDAGPAPFFPAAGAVLAIAVAAGLASSSWRSFGSASAALPDGSPAA